MLSFIPGSLHWRREIWIRERADRDADHRRKTLRFPPYRRSTYAAEVERDSGAAVRPSSELGRRSFRDLGLFLGEEGCNAKGRTRSTLTIEAVAKRNTGRLTATADHKLAALTCCFPEHVAVLNTIRTGVQSEVGPPRVGWRSSS